jgi:hypothetical protein
VFAFRACVRRALPSLTSCLGNAFAGGVDLPTLRFRHVHTKVNARSGVRIVVSSNRQQPDAFGQLEWHSPLLHYEGIAPQQRY